MDSNINNTTTPNLESPPVCLSISNVSKFYENKQTVHAIDDLTLNINEGEFLAIVGPSGCGKSTLMSLLAGFGKPTKGEILLRGKPINGPGLDRLIMFQEHALFPWLNVIENVAFGVKNKLSCSWRRARTIAMEFLELVELKDFANSKIHELSGGMKHRVALARSLAPDPLVLLVDEPFPGLDMVTKLHLYAELQQIFMAKHKTIIVVTHDSKEAVCLGDRVIVLSPRPSKIQAEVKIDSPRPRKIEDTAIIPYSMLIDAHLQSGAGE